MCAVAAAEGTANREKVLDRPPSARRISLRKCGPTFAIAAQIAQKAGADVWHSCPVALALG